MGRRSRYQAVRDMCVSLRVHVCEEEGSLVLSSEGWPWLEMPMWTERRGCPYYSSFFHYSPTQWPNILIPFHHPQLFQTSPSNLQVLCHPSPIHLKSPPRSPIPPHIETLSEYAALPLDTSLADVAVLLSVPVPAFSLVLGVISVSWTPVAHIKTKLRKKELTTGTCAE